MSKLKAVKLFYDNGILTLDNNERIKINKLIITTDDDDGIILNTDLCLNNKRIKCLADPIDDNDVVTKHKIDEIINAGVGGNISTNNSDDPLYYNRAFIAGGNSDDSGRRSMYDIIQIVHVGNIDNSVLYGHLEVPRSSMAGTSNGRNGKAILFGGTWCDYSIPRCYSQNEIQSINMSLNNGNGEIIGNLDGPRTFDQNAASSNGTDNNAFLVSGWYNYIYSDQIVKYDINDINNSSLFATMEKPWSRPTSSNGKNGIMGMFGGFYKSGTRYLTAEIKYFNMYNFTDINLFGELIRPNVSANTVSDDTNNRVIIAGGFQVSPATRFDEIQIVVLINPSDAVMFGKLETKLRAMASNSNGTGEYAEFDGGSTNSGIDTTHRRILNFTTPSNSSIFSELSYGVIYMSGNMSTSLQ